MSALPYSAVCIDRNSNGRHVTLDEAVEIIREGKLQIWLHLLAEDLEGTRALLQDKLGFHPLAVEDALTEYDRPSIQEFDHTVFISVSAVTPTEEYVEAAFFLQDHALVTVSRKPIPAIDLWVERWREHHATIGKKPAFVMHALIDEIVDAYFPLLDLLEDEIEDLTDKIFEGDSTQLPTLAMLKKRLLAIRRHIVPTRDILNSLLRRDLRALPTESVRYFQDVYDHSLRITELVDVNRDALTAAMEMHLSMVSNNLNVVMRKMTVIATVLMSAGLIAGIYGMNFDKLPELHWAYGYPFSLALMTIIGVIELWIFHRLDWW